MRILDILSSLPSPAPHPVVLELDLARGVLETRPSNPLQALQAINATTMAVIRRNLHRAAGDENVRGMIVHAAESGQPMAVLDEIGQLIGEFAQHKPVVAWSESFGEFANSLGIYKLATAADQIWLQPTGEVGIGGVEVTITLLKGMLNKAGVEPEFGQRKEYKTAGDQFAAEDVTEANREMMTRIGQSIVDDAVATIASRRGLEVQQVWDAVNDSPLPAARALELGLVDQLGYRDEVYAACLDKWETTPEHLRFVSRWQQRPTLTDIRRKRPRIAQVSLRGPITTGRGTPSLNGAESAGADVVDEHLRAAMRDDRVKAVILDVESPGGSAVASDFIRRSVLRVRESGRPVVARMGSVAASGGYYAAMGADEIVAQPTTLTGSIGVVAGKFVTSRLYDKLDLKRESIRIGARAGMLSSATHFSEEDWRKLDEALDRIYADFTRLAAEDRGMAIEELEPLARGRVWTGADAKERGLVDHLGGWKQALERVCDLAGLDVDDVEVTKVGHSGLVDKLLPAASSESKSNVGAARRIGVDDLLQRAGALVGVPVFGPVSLPWRIDVS